MEFRKLKYILTVAEHRSITRAAEELFITQPSLSHFIAKTEEEMGVRLFDRSTTPLSLTFAGEQYVETALQILRLNEQLTKELRDTSQNIRGRINVGMPRERAAYMIPLLLPPFHKIYPGIEINLVESKSDSLIEAVTRGRTDFAIMPEPHRVAGLECEMICQEELVLVAGDNMIQEQHLLPGNQNTVDLKKLVDLPFIMMKRGHGIRTFVDQVFRSQGLKPSVHIETTSNITTYRLATAGYGVAIVPRMTISLAQAIQTPHVFSLSGEPIFWDIIALYRSDSYIGVAERAFFDMARSIFRYG